MPIKMNKKSLYNQFLFQNEKPGDFFTKNYLMICSFLSPIISRTISPGT
jgi:hypothetical protein